MNNNNRCTYTERWEDQRAQWREGNGTVSSEGAEIEGFYEDEPYLEFPSNPEQVEEIKNTLKSTRRPYERFDGYYRLEDIIDQYMYVWFEETTSSD